MTVEECICTPCPMHGEVPAQFVTAYCHIRRDIYIHLLSAYDKGDELEFERALKWHFAADAIFLRRQARRGG